MLTATLFPGAIVIVGAGLNFISQMYATIAVVPLSTFFAMLAIYVFVSWPLVILGTLLGRHATGDADFPCRVNSLPRPIPARSFFNSRYEFYSDDLIYYKSPRWSIIALTGVLPFGAVFIEIFFIFSSLWAHRYYYVYGFLLLVLMILIVVSACVTIVAVYFQLNSEDWRYYKLFDTQLLF